MVSEPTLYQDYVIHIVHPQFTGHVTWEGRRAESPANALPITLTLRHGHQRLYLLHLTTDANGNFSVNGNTCPMAPTPGASRGRSTSRPAGLCRLYPRPSTSVEMGLQPAGDANNDNLVDITDFGILYASFGTIRPRADFNGDQVVDITDFALLRGNFGHLGNRPACPAQAAAGAPCWNCVRKATPRPTAARCMWATASRSNSG